MINLNIRTYKEINMDIASRMVAIRKRKKISQAKLAKLSAVSLGSIKRFEQTGEISLSSLTKISIALNTVDEMDELFTKEEFSSIQEIINGQS